METRLRELREYRHMTQIELSKRSGISWKTISQIECGHRKRIYINTLRKLANGLRVPVEALFEKRKEEQHGKTAQGAARSAASA